MNVTYDKALNLVRNKIKYLRGCVSIGNFDINKPAEIEVNKFFYEGECIDRIMIVLRSNGCEHYKQTGGCSMCAHYNGTPINNKITSQNYINQWISILNNECLDYNSNKKINLNDYSVLCLYNLGSLLNKNEIENDALEYIFKSINNFKNIRKIIIESRAEYINEESLKIIKNSCDKLIEIGIGVESTNDLIRNLCHHKNIIDKNIFKKSIDIIHKFDYKALSYVNFKPCFLTEQESIDDAIKTTIDCFNMNFDAVSIEPTSLQEYALTDYLYKLGYYRVPWLWSIREIINGIYKELNNKNLDIRIGGYFDEEILSGSQGTNFIDKNEIFPHETSSNCIHCSKNFIENIKKFNMTYEIQYLNNIQKCKYCYSLWEDSCNVKDSRNIEQRIIDIL